MFYFVDQQNDNFAKQGAVMETMIAIVTTSNPAISQLVPSKTPSDAHTKEDGSPYSRKIGHFWWLNIFCAQKCIRLSQEPVLPPTSSWSTVAVLSYQWKGTL